ncbi:uncharacterized protein LOC107045657 [Diachasma alloeum]|uniref:uncharacterized protein LOC107045657 n=1 Tax=Diachasma alloeum TaxID=454923 RepID=UPI0007384863|nr:uncharacterized protein LOC107045657 [Diachasma alloeum]
MGHKHKKRKHEDREEDKSLRKKVHELDEKIERLFEVVTSASGTVNKENQPANAGTGVPVLDNSDVLLEASPTKTSDVPAPDASVLDTQLRSSPPTILSPIINMEETVEEDELDPEILEVLGADPSKPKYAAIELQDQLKTRWAFWFSFPLDKDEMSEMMDQYPRGTDKCCFEAPKLNPEIPAMSTDALVQRDNKFIISQNLTGSALVALRAAISSLPGDDEIDKLKLLRKLCDTGKMMIQVHRGLSSTRRAFVSPSLNKQVREALDFTTPDKLPYGSNLSEKVKEVKTLAKLGQDLKVTTANKPARSHHLNSKSSFVKFIRIQTSMKPRAQDRASNSSKQSHHPKRKNVLQAPPQEAPQRETRK